MAVAVLPCGSRNVFEGDVMEIFIAILVYVFFASGFTWAAMNVLKLGYPWSGSIMLFVFWPCIVVFFLGAMAGKLITIIPDN